MIETLDKTFSFAEFEIDAARRRLLKNGQTLPLNPKAFDLLLTLIENRGAILSKNELLDRVWADQFVEENNLTVHISALRKALGERKNEHRFIVTVPGKGYSFVAPVRSNGAEEREPTAFEISRSDFVSINQRLIAPAGEPDDLPPAAPEDYAAAQQRRETLVGRTREVAEIKNLLRGDAANLITLTGAGGTGKTRLARAVADELTADFPDGVFWVELAAVTDAELVIPAIAQTLGVKESGGKYLFETLKNFLRERRTLLILDNFEQLTRAAPLLDELCAAASRLRILTTSRHALRAETEREFAVTPLAVPPRETAFSVAELARYAAIALFLRRAQAAKPGFVLAEENAPVVAEICQKLDGLPLAIELAAARLKLLAPTAILRRLENSLQLLTGGAKNLPARQRTMRGAIEWSYDLLDANEKVAFRRLAVFVGGLSVEAAETVCDSRQIQITNDESAEDQTGILDLISSLIDNNLLASMQQADGGTRLRMLEVVREFALECLEKSGELDKLRRGHARCFLGLAEAAEPHLSAEQSIVWLEKLETDIDNLRAALLWSAENDAETMARLAAAARFYWINKSHLTEGVEWLNAALKQSAAAPLDRRFKLLGGLGSLKRLQGDHQAAAEFYGRGLAEGEAAGNRRQIALASSGLGTALYLQGDAEAARKFYERGLTISRELQDDFGVAAALNCLGVLAMDSRETTTARLYMEESLMIYRRLGNKEAVGTALSILGAIAVEEGGAATAQAYFTEGLALAGELGNKINLADSLNGFAALAAESGDAQRAARLAGAAEKLQESIGYNREPYEKRFFDEYLAKVRRALGEETFADSFEQGKVLNLNEAVALARRPPPENGATGKRRNESFSESNGQSEIIIENRSFSRVIIEEETGAPDYKIIEANASESKAARSRYKFLPKAVYAGLAAALLLAGGLTFWFWNGGGAAGGNQLNLSKLTTSGKVTNAALTPDSKYAVYSQTETSGESLWLRHIATGSQKEILPVKPVRFVGLAASPDGNTIYATVFSPALPDPQTWRVPLLGGSTEEISGVTTGAAVAFSPAGDRIAFVESRSATNENHLLIADASGANKKLLSRAHGETRSFSNFNANPVAWSPGGDEIACAVDEKTATGATKAGIILVNPANGGERFVSERRWDYINHLTWMDAENLAFIAYKRDPWQGQVWSISRATGEARQITNDLNNYAWLASAGGNLLTVQKNAVSRVSISDFDERANQFAPREILSASGDIDNVAFASDGAILYVSSQSGRREIWRVNPDGSNPSQLTVNANAGLGLSVSPVDGSIVFGATSGGKHSLKLANADGKNIRPLTDGADDVYPNFTADGQAVIFQKGLDNKLITLWRVSLDGKIPAQLTKTHATHPAVSADGAQTAYYFMDGEIGGLWRVGLISSADGAFLNKIIFPKAVTERRMRWHPSGKYIGQILYAGETINLLLLPTVGGDSTVISGLGKGDVNWFEFSPDGKQIVVSSTVETQDVVYLSK